MHTSTMVPKDGAPIRAVVCLCHGYADNISFAKTVHYQRFVRRGIAVAMIDYEGHGRSDGRNCLIPCWDALLGDVQRYFSHVARAKFPGKRKFLLGESMGGAVAYDLMSRHRADYEGVILVAPMVKIAVAPPDWVVDLLYNVVGAPGTVNRFSALPIAPTSGDIFDGFKDKEKMKLSLRSPFKYDRKPRLATARELLDSTKRIGPTFGQFSAPFLILHGLDDRVTCPKISELLYKESPSKDKDIKLYPGMLHNLTTGGMDEEIETVFGDAIAWTVERSKNLKLH